MVDRIAIYADARELGRLERRLSLRGKIEIGSGVRSSAELCLTRRGLWIVAALDRERGVLIDVVERPDVRYRTGAVSDRLLIGEIELGLPPGRGDDVRRALALARLRRRADGVTLELCQGRHIEAPSEIERTFLAGYLQPGETLLAWLSSATSLPIYSSILGEAEGELRLCVTDSRQSLIALSEVGDVREMPLPARALRVERGIARSTVRAGDELWQTSLANAQLYLELVTLPELAPNERLREVARLNLIGRDAGSEPAGFARFLLERAASRDDPLAGSALLLLSAEAGALGSAEPSRELERLRAAEAPPVALANLWQAFELSTDAARRLIDRLRPFGAVAEPWALELEIGLHARLRERGGFESARADIALAEHLLALGQTERATALLEARMRDLPGDGLDQLLPPSDADLTRGGVGQTIAIRVHELLAEARGAPGKLDPRALGELARLEPLVLARIRALATAASGDLERRSRQVLAALEPRGLAPAPDLERTPAAEIRVLAPGTVERLLRHPLVREGGALLGRLQALLAAVPAPDHAVLRDYCEQLSAERHPEAAQALSDAARALGVADVRAYVSRGNKSVGLRAYESSPPFVLIGVRHLEGEPRFRMSAAELRFAITAEVAHLRYGHTRVTSSEVWAGALNKSRQGLDLALGVLPVLKGWKVADRFGKIASKIPIDAAQRVLDNRGAIGKRVRRGLGITAARRGNDAVLSRINEELVAAHRVMQLTADRAALLLTGDLRAALRAMLLVRGDYREVLDEIELDGLDAVLARRDTDGAMQHQDLAVRAGALVAFFLSDEYARLRTEIDAHPRLP